MTAVLEVNNLTLGIQQQNHTAIVINQIGFTLKRGETLALLGESGCGKSMTAMALMQLLPPAVRIVDGSEIIIDQQNLLALPEVAMRQFRGRRISQIFQEPMTSLNPVLTIGDQIAEAIRTHFSLSAKKVRERALELLSLVGIPEAERRYKEYPHQLSGGMKQRIVIAMALAGEPDILVADEPTTALDVTIQAQILALLQEIQTKTGMAILLITHDLAVVKAMSDRLIVMYAGNIVESATTKDFFKEPLHPYSQRLLQALPSLNRREEQLITIPGIVPTLQADATGCRFAGRCQYTKEICYKQTPRWHTSQTKHGVLCHRFTKSYAHYFQAEETITAKSSQLKATEDISKSVLEVKGLKVHFPVRKGLLQRVVGNIKAVDGVSLTIKEGETLALVGESGCGKTTVGKGILNLIKPTAGELYFNGQDYQHNSRRQGHELRQQMQFIFQDPFSSMNPRMMIADIIAEGMRIHRIKHKRNELIPRIEELLSAVGMPTDILDRYPHEFSGGQRQRICIARALAVEPKLIICDEPTSALDVSVQAQILNLLQELQRKLGLSYLFITHNLAVVGYLAQRVAVMYLGRIVEEGSVTEILTQAKHPYTQSLLAAVPDVEQETAQQFMKLTGEPPSPFNPPQGCHFAARCPHVMAKCRQAYPHTTNITDTHKVKCFLHDD